MSNKLNRSAECASRFLQDRMRNPVGIPMVPSEYSASYSSLLAIANRLDDQAGSAELLMLGCATYAWMPTILKTWDFSLFESGKLTVAMLRDLSCPDAAANLLQASIETPLLNNSWVGTSKFLHFINPDIFPIWDSRVAKRFNVQPHKVNQKSVFLDYMVFCHQTVASSGDELACVSKVIAPDKPDGITPIRALELLLFL